MHIIADARQLIPTAQKLPVLLSRDREGHGINHKPLGCATSLASKKGGRLRILFWRVRAQSLIKNDRCVRMLVSRHRSRNEPAEINELKECMAEAPLTFREPNPSPQNARYRMVPHIFCDVLALRYQYRRKWQTRSENVVARTPCASFRALTVRLVAALKAATNQTRDRGRIPRGGWRCRGFDWPFHSSLVCAAASPHVDGSIYSPPSKPLWLVQPVKSRLGRYDCATPSSCTDFFAFSFSLCKLLVIDTTVSPWPSRVRQPLLCAKL
jgi:hypothetical protein